MRALFAVLWALCAAHGAARAEAEWHLLPEPKFMPHEIVWPVPGSERAVCLPVKASPNEEPVPLAMSDLDDPALTRERILEEGRTNASRILASLEPTYVRSPRGAIRYAVIASDNPLTTSAVFAPEFADRFLETIGPDALVVIPNRFRIYIFPRSDPPGSDLSELIFSDYHATNYPVSREVFEARGGSLRALGLFR
jgi:hypothetical protein